MEKSLISRVISTLCRSPPGTSERYSYYGGTLDNMKQALKWIEALEKQLTEHATNQIKNRGVVTKLGSFTVTKDDGESKWDEKCNDAYIVGSSTTFELPPALKKSANWRKVVALRGDIRALKEIIAAAPRSDAEWLMGRDLISLTEYMELPLDSEWEATPNTVKLGEKWDSIYSSQNMSNKTDEEKQDALSACIFTCLWDICESPSLPPDMSCEDVEQLFIDPVTASVKTAVSLALADLSTVQGSVSPQLALFAIVRHARRMQAPEFE